MKPEPESAGDVPLATLIQPLESGSRPKGGVRGIESGVPSIGGEHLTAEGTFDFSNVKFVPLNFFESMRRGRIRRGDVLVVKDGATTGKVALVRDDFPFDRAVVNEHVFICRPLDGVDPRYLFWFLYSAEGQRRILEHFRGSAQGGINQQFGTGTYVPWVPYRRQRSLGQLLDRAHECVRDGASHLERAHHSLQRLRLAVLAAAGSGSLTADWREDAGLDEWHVERAADLCPKVQSGGTPRSGFVDIPGVPFLKVYNIVEQYVDFDYRPQYVPESVHRGVLKKSIAYPGDVIMNIVGPPLGKVAVIPNDFPEWNLNQAITIFRPGERVLGEWLYYYLCSGLFMDNDLVTRGSAGQSNISLTQCRELLIPAPTIDEQEEIIRRVRVLLNAADELAGNINTAAHHLERASQAVLAKSFGEQLQLS